MVWYSIVQVRGRLDSLWANSERLEMLASKEPVARRQVLQGKETGTRAGEGDWQESRGRRSGAGAGDQKIK